MLPWKGSLPRWARWCCGLTDQPLTFLRRGFKSCSDHHQKMRCRRHFGFECQSLTRFSRSYNSPNCLAQVCTIGSFYSREGQSRNSRVQQVSAEVHWQRCKGKSRACEHLPARSLGLGPCNDFLAFSSTKFGKGRKGKSFSQVLQVCACMQDRNWVEKSAFFLSRHRDLSVESPLAEHPGWGSDRGFSPLYFLLT